MNIRRLVSFGGALVPLLIASEIPGPRWTAVAVAVGCLGALSTGVGYTTESCKTCWALVLAAAGGLLAALEYSLSVV